MDFAIITDTNSRVVSADNDKTQVYRFSHVCYSHDGNRLVVLNKRLNSLDVHELTTGDDSLHVEFYRIYGSTPTFVCFSDDDSSLIVSLVSPDGVLVIDSTTGELLESYLTFMQLLSLIPLRDNKRLLSFQNRPFIFDLESNTIVRVFEGLKNVHQSCLSNDQTRVVASTGKWTSMVWDLETGTELLRFDGSNAVFSIDDSTIIVSERQNILFLDSTTGEVMRMIRRPNRGACSIVFMDIIQNTIVLLIIDGLIEFRDQTTGEITAVKQVTGVDSWTTLALRPNTVVLM
jgi:WD40 repeat protein